MNIGIKYCGGCKTTYDRVKYVNKLTKNYPENNFEPVKDGASYDVILIVNGCKTACANHEALVSGNKIFLNSIEDFENLTKSDTLK